MALLEFLMNEMINFSSLTYSQPLDSVKTPRQQYVTNEGSAPHMSFIIPLLKLKKHCGYKAGQSWKKKGSQIPSSRHDTSSVVTD